MRSGIRRFLFLIFSAAILFCGSGYHAAAYPGGGKEPSASMQLEFAEKFSVDYYEDGCKLLSTADGQRFLIVPQDAEIPDIPDRDIVILRKPVRNIYLAATAAMGLFDALNRLDTISLSGTRADGWYIENARLAMEKGLIRYAGKYSEPDYELLLSEGCSLAIESQMIRHTPETAEKLRELGIPVLIDLSSSEPHPLGRTEWIRFYAAFFDDEEKAERIFREQADHLQRALSDGNTGKTVAFFYISSSGLAVVRKSGDYVSKMISLAGGNYVFQNIGDPEKSTSTVPIEMETFFAAARDADCIIYNSTIGGEVRTLSELIGKSSLLSEFKAVKNGNVWCTEKNMYQDTTHLGLMINSFHQIFSGEADRIDVVPYLYRLK